VDLDYQGVLYTCPKCDGKFEGVESSDAMDKTVETHLASLLAGEEVAGEPLETSPSEAPEGDT
jgi:hypothetical protein